MANVIYRGPVEREPETINIPVSGALLPGTFVVKDVSGSAAQASSGEGRLMLLSNPRFLERDIETAYTSGETGIQYRLEPEQEYQAVAVTGNYADQSELTVNSSGQLAAATSGDLVVAFVDGAKNITDATGFLDVVIATRYTKPAQELGR